MSEENTFDKLKYPDIVERAKTEIARLDRHRAECLDKFEDDLAKYLDIDLEIIRTNLNSIRRARATACRILGEHK